MFSYFTGDGHLAVCSLWDFNCIQLRYFECVPDVSYAYIYFNYSFPSVLNSECFPLIFITVHLSYVLLWTMLLNSSNKNLGFKHIFQFQNINMILKSFKYDFKSLFPQLFSSTLFILYCLLIIISTSSICLLLLSFILDYRLDFSFSLHVQTLLKSCWNYI